MFAFSKQDTCLQTTVLCFFNYNAVKKNFNGISKVIFICVKLTLHVATSRKNINHFINFEWIKIRLTPCIQFWKSDWKRLTPDSLRFIPSVSPASEPQWSSNETPWNSESETTEPEPHRRGKKRNEEFWRLEDCHPLKMHDTCNIALYSNIKKDFTHITGLNVWKHKFMLKYK